MRDSSENAGLNYFTAYLKSDRSAAFTVSVLEILLQAEPQWFCC
jgi:hypothetical protein